MRTLVVVAHLDDETFGMGGTLVKLQGEDVKVVSICKGRDEENSKKRVEAFSSIMQQLGFKYKIHDYFDISLDNVSTSEISKLIEWHIDDFLPSRVITVSEKDLHQDHRKVSHAVKISARPSRFDCIQEILEFKIPGCQPYEQETYDTVSNIVNELPKKMLMCEYYETENLPQLEDKEYFKTIYRKL